METAHPFPIVGVGASAGGYEAFVELLRALPGPIGAAFIFVQHLDPTHESMLVHLLSRVTTIPVQEATDGTVVEPDRIYLARPSATMTIARGALSLQEVPAEPRVFRLPIDLFFKSLAAEEGHRAIGVLLSGTGTDGTLGLRAIKEEGGIALVQDPATAKFAGMPQSAIAETAVDFVLPPGGIAHELERLAGHPYIKTAVPLPSVEEAAPPAQSQPPGEGLGAVLRLLKGTVGMDFTGYKQSTIARRTVRRMTLLGKETMQEYVQYCREHPEEVTALYHDLLIKVTSFFREPDSFEALKQEVFPILLKDRPPDRPFRVWVPGCATGEEAYTLAIVLFEFLAERPEPPPPVQIFATDIDDIALAKARAGTYLENIAPDVSPERLRRFFTHVDHTYKITKQVREVCTFASHNLLTDPPFASLDLISCRNLFIYLDPAMQRRVVPNLHYGLRPGGFLTLGAAENLADDGLFTLADRKHKVYMKQAAPGDVSNSEIFRERAVAAIAPVVPQVRPADLAGRPQNGDVLKEADRSLLSYYAPVGVLVDQEMEILQFRGDTGHYLLPSPGKASFNLVKMAREGLLSDLRAALDEAKKTDDVAIREGITVFHEGQPLDVTLRVMPVRAPMDAPRHYMVLFEEPGPPTVPRQKGRRRTASSASRQAEAGQVDQLRNELQATKDYLQSAIEDRDTSNEELRSANEEVLSAVEELQSTNEELETAKEELQSTNEELITSNEEVHRRNEELARSIDDLQNLFDNGRLPIVLLDKDLRIRQFSAVTQLVLNVIPTDVGRPITDLRLNIGVTGLARLLRQVIANGEVVEREVQDQEGHWYLLRVNPYRTVEGVVDGVVLLLIDITAVKDVDHLTQLLEERQRAEAAAQAARRYAESLVETVQHPLLVLGEGLRVQSANPAFYETFQTSRDEAIGHPFYELAAGQWDIPALRTQLEDVLANNNVIADYEVATVFPRIGGKVMLLNAQKVEQADDEAPKQDHVLLAIQDITERKQYEAGLMETNRQKNEFLAMLSHELRNPLGPIRSSVELLRSHPGDDVAHDEVLDALDRQVSILVRLIDELLDVSRVTTGRVHLQRADVDVNSIVQRTADAAKPEIGEHRHELSVSLAGAPVWVHADPVRLEQVVVNLLTNAAKYTPDGGRIWLTVERDGDEAVIRVKDSGMGMEPALLSRVFELFAQGERTLARSQSGLGIGLALVKSLVELHDGTVAATSEGPGKGSEFIVRLPVVQTPAPHSAPPPVRPPAAVEEVPLRVLMVDDNPDMAQLFGMLLRRAGHQVRTANAGQAALETALEFRPEVVLLDIGLPDMDGYEVARRMRQEEALQSVVLVAMTGYGMESDRQRSREAGFDHHLVKPASPDDLRRIFSAIQPRPA